MVMFGSSLALRVCCNGRIPVPLDLPGLYCIGARLPGRVRVDVAPQRRGIDPDMSTQLHGGELAGRDASPDRPLRCSEELCRLGTVRSRPGLGRIVGYRLTGGETESVSDPLVQVTAAITDRPGRYAHVPRTTTFDAATGQERGRHADVSAASRSFRRPSPSCMFAPSSIPVALGRCTTRDAGNSALTAGNRSAESVVAGRVRSYREPASL